jgi:hypothetical protein
VGDFFKYYLLHAWPPLNPAAAKLKRHGLPSYRFAELGVLNFASNV